jgi:hypothetical protein
MKGNSNNVLTSQPFRYTIWAYTGAFLTAIILLIFVHEVSHYLAYRWKGYEEVSIRINPFSGTTITSQEVDEADAVFIILGGTVFNLAVASLTALALRSTRSPYWLPLQMYPPTAFLIEGMVILAGLFFQERVTDFAWLVEFGGSPVLVGTLGVVFSAIGGWLTYRVWYLLGIDAETPYRQLISLNLPFLLYSLLGALIGYAFLQYEMVFLKKFLTATMMLHWWYVGVRIFLAPVLLTRIRTMELGDPLILTKGSSVFSITLGMVSWVLSFIVLN